MKTVSLVALALTALPLAAPASSHREAPNITRECHVGEHLLCAGDVHVAPPGSWHPVITPGLGRLFCSAASTRFPFEPDCLDADRWSVAVLKPGSDEQPILAYSCRNARIGSIRADRGPAVALRGSRHDLAGTAPVAVTARVVVALNPPIDNRPGNAPRKRWLNS
jgi:hypothetical protein